MKSDIIFLSDIRLNSTVQHAAINDLKKRFQLRGYNFFYNSVSAARGVGILIANKLKCTIRQESKDQIGNYLLMLIQINDCNIIIGAIYGPNDENPAFYDELETAVRNLGDCPKILGGDWNATWDSRDI